ncbi:TPA: hypothetical protein P5S68_005091, partial [Salmonella enterica subsp. enterica serovar Concord]|nr:hypothetical protein [Salmonella enterica subsp. enterica serovar Concord]
MTEQTNKKLMLDESPDMPLQFKWRKFGGAIFTATQTMEGTVAKLAMRQPFV